MVMFSLPSSSIMPCRWRWWSCHVIISYLFENACPALALPPIYAHSRRCDFKLKPSCHNRSQQEISDWPLGQRVCCFDFFFLMEMTVGHLFAPRDRNAPSAVWRICFITGLTGVCKHTVSICGASVGCEPWTTAELVPSSGHGGADWECVRGIWEGNHACTRSPEGPDALRKYNSPFSTWAAFSHLLPIVTRDLVSYDKSLYFFSFFVSLYFSTLQSRSTNAPRLMLGNVKLQRKDLCQFRTLLCLNKITFGCRRVHHRSD